MWKINPYYLKSLRVLDFPYQSTAFHDWFNGHSSFHSAEFKSYINWVSVRLLSSRFYFGNLDTEGTFACYHLTSYICQSVKRMLATQANSEHIKCPLFYVNPTIIYNKSLFWSCSTVQATDIWYAFNSPLKHYIKIQPQCFVENILFLSMWWPIQVDGKLDLSNSNQSTWSRK